MRKIKLTNKTKHKKKDKSYVIFANGIEIRVPHGYALGPVFTITGLIKL